MNGISIAVAPEFSVKKFWSDMHKNESTCFVYVREVATCLLADSKSKGLTGEE